LLTAGLADERIVIYHKRLEKYGIQEFRILVDYLKAAQSVVVTPHVLAETSNLMIFGLLSPDLEAVQMSFKALVERCDEVWILARDITVKPEFEWLGLTDSCWLSALDEDTILLSDDGRLVTEALRRGIPAITLEQLLAA
jgi:rRNA-processing protein FCF1